jgi:assimilatory nitrate reductase catalytic subunit
MTTTQARPVTDARTRSMSSHPRFLQGVFGFEGQGLERPTLLDPALTYVVPRDREAQMVYFRGGNASDDLVDVVIMRDGEPMRHFPMGAKESTHVPLRVVEDLLADTKLEVFIGAEGSGKVVIDLGLVEI